LAEMPEAANPPNRDILRGFTVSEAEDLS